jgi:hypothetical protein
LHITSYEYISKNHGINIHKLWVSMFTKNIYLYFGWCLHSICIGSIRVSLQQQQQQKKVWLEQTTLEK